MDSINCTRIEESYFKALNVVVVYDKEMSIGLENSKGHYSVEALTNGR